MKNAYDIIFLVLKWHIAFIIIEVKKGMNQILYTNNPKRKGGPLELKTIYLIFAILCILFGLILVGQASFSMSKESQEGKTNIPMVQIM